MPLAGDWNGDGRYGVGLYNHAEGKFYLRLDDGGVINERHGARGNDWTPVTGDWNGDGTYGVGLHHDGHFHLDTGALERFGPRGYID